MMSFFSCPEQDPLVRKAHDAYGANLLSTPRVGIDPLAALAVRDRKVELRGQLQYMVQGPLPQLPVISAPAEAVSGVRSGAVDFELGLNLLANFLAALGVPVPGADSLASFWEGASGFTFEPRNAVEHQVAAGALGQALEGHALAQTPDTEPILIDRSIELMFITRTLTTRSFAIRAVGAPGQTIDVAVGSIADLIGKAYAYVSFTVEHDNSVTFIGSSPVTFGFAVIPCAVDAQRNLKFGRTRASFDFARAAPVASELEGAPAIDGSGLLSFDELLA
jgi:hypothetical protein